MNDEPKINVLIADDDPDIRTLVQFSLRKAGFEVLAVENGQEALERLSDKIDAVILDLQMPVMDGMECLRHVRNRYPDLKPIILTASDDVSNAVDSMKQGAFDYVIKPFKTRDLVALVQKAYASHDQARRLRKAEIELAQAREHEISTAARIQESLLLGRPPQNLEGVQIANMTIPSQKIDGDFYDFLRHSELCFDLVVGDVMGKGIPAALLGAAVKSHLLRVLVELTRQGGGEVFPPTEKIVASVHRDMIEQMEDLETFVTLIYARFELTQKIFTFVDCGHMRTIHFKADVNEISLLQGQNMPLGFPEVEPFRPVSVPFGAGDLFFFYSDGLTEAKNGAGELFGEKRLAALVRENARCDPETLNQRIRREIVTFSQSEIFEDDFTCVVVRIEKEKPVKPNKSAESKFELTSDLSNLNDVRIFVREVCQKIPAGRIKTHEIEKIVLAANEVVVNIIKHAYQGRNDGQIQIDANVSKNAITFQFFDRGEPFDPDSAEAPKFDGSQDGGFGLYIISQSVDEVTYSRSEEGLNCTRVKINLSGGH